MDYSKFKVGDMVELTCSGGYLNFNAGDIVEAVNVSSGGFFNKGGLFFANNEGQLHNRKLTSTELDSQFWSQKAEQDEEERNTAAGMFTSMDEDRADKKEKEMSAEREDSEVLDELSLSRYTLDELKIELARREELKESRYKFKDDDGDVFEATISDNGEKPLLNISVDGGQCEIDIHLHDVPRLLNIINNAVEDHNA